MLRDLSTLEKRETIYYIVGVLGLYAVHYIFLIPKYFYIALGIYLVGYWFFSYKPRLDSGEKSDYLVIPPAVNILLVFLAYYLNDYCTAHLTKDVKGLVIAFLSFSLLQLVNCFVALYKKSNEN